MIMNLGFVKKIGYIYAALKNITHAKAIFIADLEQGREVYIPPELSQSSLPQSYTYYDCILNLT
jgi:hypothetical protein